MLGFPIHCSWGLRLWGFQLFGFYCTISPKSLNPEPLQLRPSLGHAETPHWSSGPAAPSLQKDRGGGGRGGPRLKTRHREGELDQTFALTALCLPSSSCNWLGSSTQQSKPRLKFKPSHTTPQLNLWPRGPFEKQEEASKPSTLLLTLLSSKKAPRNSGPLLGQKVPYSILLLLRFFLMLLVQKLCLNEAVLEPYKPSMPSRLPAARGRDASGQPVNRTLQAEFSEKSRRGLGMLRAASLCILPASLRDEGISCFLGVKKLKDEWVNTRNNESDVSQGFRRDLGDETPSPF